MNWYYKWHIEFVAVKKVILTSYLLVIFVIADVRAGSYIFKHVGAESELSQSWVTSIRQDYLGFIWIGTTDGLYRYDGNNIKSYRNISGDTLSLSGNNISSVFEDKENNLWIASSRGISRYNRDRDKFYYHNHWPKENFLTVISDDSGDIIIGSYTGVFIYSPEKDSFRVILQYINKSVPFDGRQGAFSFDNKILVAGADGVSELDPRSGNFARFATFPSGTTGASINTLTRDYNGTYWIGSRESGLFYAEPTGSSTMKRLTKAGITMLDDVSVISILASTDSLLWVGIENNGILILNLKDYYKGDFDIISIQSDPDNGLVNNSVYSMYEDQQKNIWIGTYGGLNIYNKISDNFKHVLAIKGSKGLNNNIINGFFEVGKKIWIATEGGVNIYDPVTSNYEYLRNIPGNRNSLGSDAVFSIAEDRQGKIWIGTWAGGLNVYNPGTESVFRYLSGNPGASVNNNNIFSVITDENDIIWIGTMGGGLNKFDPASGRFTYYTHELSDPESISNNWVRQVFLDSKKRLWVSTYGSLDLMDRERGTFIHFNPDEADDHSFNDNGAIVIFEDSKQHLWFGTEYGLNIFNEKDTSFYIFESSHGLPSNVVSAILEDNEGNLWLATNRGIVKFVDGISVPEEPTFIIYDRRDGLQGDKFNHRSALKTSDGLMYFGGKNGFNCFQPDDLKSNDFVPPVLITEFLISNKNEVFPGSGDAKTDKHITQAEKIVLRYRNRVFTINYAALNYIIPEKNQYKYMLEGFEESWNDAGNKTNATYTNLDPGKYTFRVIAANNSGLWNTQGASLNIIILPPWYRTNVAYFFYVIIITLIILTYRRFIVLRTQLKHEITIERIEKDKLEQINKMKSRFFTNISHEFRTPLTLILGPLDNLLSDINLKPGISQQLGIIGKNARRLLRLINQLLDISALEANHMKLKVTKGNIAEYIKEIGGLFRWLAAQRKISFEINIEMPDLDTYFDADKVEKITYNLIANAFQYTSENGKITVEGYLRQGKESGETAMFELRVKDSGMGITPDDQKKIFEEFYFTGRNHFTMKHGSGVGLSLVKGLIKVYRGNIDFNSTVGKGTEFIVCLPVEIGAFRPEEIDTEHKDHIPLTLDIYDLEQGYIDDISAEGNKVKVTENKDTHPVVLIVEDNIEMREFVKDIFSKNSYFVLEASDGKEAIGICEETIPDIVISDIKMPNMDGFELLGSLKSNERTSHIPVILLTAKADNEDRIKGVSTGADAYITKPFDGKLLSATVRNLVNSRKKLIEKFRQNLSIEPSGITITSVDEKFLQRAVAFVEKHMADAEYSVDMFSRDMGMSRSHLHRKFIGLTGLSPSSFIRTIRMKRAAQYLVKGQLTVSEILFEVGIKSRSYFIKSFKEQFGLLPTEFAANNKEK